jgi:hypothetical protein
MSRVGSSEVICGLRDIAPLCLQVAIAVLLEAAHEYISVSTPLSALLCPLDLTSDHCPFVEVHEGEGVSYKEKNVVLFGFDCVYIDSRRNAGGRRSPG